MSDYIIVTDSACDINPGILKNWGVDFVRLGYLFDKVSTEYSYDDVDSKIFYDRMRKGETVKTSAVNPETFAAAFDDILKQGTDFIYLGFSSGLSTTFNSARIAADELKEKYPDRKIICIDSLCASAGQGLLLRLAVNKKASNCSIEELEEYIKGIIPNLCHWFTVDDLVYLKRGGRISSAVAFVGAVLGIKPILHVDDDGKLVNVTKARGRKAALEALVDKYGELASDTKNGTVFICQADCMDEAEDIKSQLKTKYGADVELITDIGPVIGAHSGPGTISIFFIGKNR